MHTWLFGRAAPQTRRVRTKGGDHHERDENKFAKAAGIRRKKGADGAVVVGDHVLYGVPVAAIGESAANASNAGTLEQAGESIQDSLTLDANGADAAAKTLKVTSGTTVSLSDYAVSRDGYTLVGWSANASADPTSAGVYKGRGEHDPLRHLVQKRSYLSQSS